AIEGARRVDADFGRVLSEPQDCEADLVFEHRLKVHDRVRLVALEAWIVEHVVDARDVVTASIDRNHGDRLCRGACWFELEDRAFGMAHHRPRVLTGDVLPRRRRTAGLESDPLA